ncbi:MAG: hypothetical protein K6C36_05495 [Clostridia bacterium]|nr:hypothetical protein [Clostridia bacterium]
MKTMKKLLSVFLAALILVMPVSAGVYAFAADADLNSQYDELANFLKVEWVRTLDHYQIKNEKASSSTESVLNDDGSVEEYETEGFSSTAHSFVYVHTVKATDDTNNSILKAANRFYTIFEAIRSTEYGTGLYSPDLLYKEVVSQLDTRFSGMDVNRVFVGGETYNVPYKVFYDESENEYGFVDNYGKLVSFGTEQDVENHSADYSYADLLRYNQLLADILDGSYTSDVVALTERNMPSEENNYRIPSVILTDERLPFHHEDAKSFFSYATIIQYFLGNATLINSGNWFHRFYFVDTTDLDSAILAYHETVNSALDEDDDPVYGLNDDWNGGFDTITAVYGIRYDRTFDTETGTKAQFSFDADNSIATLASEAVAYLPEYADAISEESNYSYFVNNADFNAHGGRAAGLSVTTDTDAAAASYNFLKLCSTEYAEDNQSFWSLIDSWKQSNNYELAHDSAATTFTSRYYALTNYNTGYHADVLNAVFGPLRMGSLANMAQLAQPNSTYPTRIVRANETDGGYTVNDVRIADFIERFDALMENEELGATIREFLPTTSAMFLHSNVYGQGYKTPKELVQLLLKSKLYTGGIVNKLMELLYPMIANLFEETIPNFVEDKASALSGIANNLINNVINDNHVYFRPRLLAEHVIAPDGSGDLGSSVPAKFQQVHDVLYAAGDSWDNVDWDLMDWYLDGTAEDFQNALSIMLFGLRTVLAVAFTTQDLNTISIGVGSLAAHLFLDELEGYKKIIIPLFKTLGLTEYSNYNARPYRARTGNEEQDDLTGDTPIDLSWWHTSQGGRYLSYQMYIEHAYLRWGSINSSGNYEGDSRYNNGNRAVNARTSIINDVLGPIISWLEYTVLEDPLGSICKLLPNLAYLVGKNVKVNGNYATYNVNEILYDIQLEIGFGALGPWSGDGLRLSSLLKMSFDSVDDILTRFVKMTYDTGVEEVSNNTKKVVAYGNSDNSVVVLGGSDAYEANPTAYPNKLRDNVWVAVSPDSDEFNANTQAHLGRSAECTFEYVVYDTTKVTYKLPHLQDRKLIEMGTPYTSSSEFFGTLSVSATQQGMVLLYVLRFLFGALQYRYLSPDNSYLPTTTTSCGERADIENAYMKYGLLQCFGLDPQKVLFSGYTIGDFVYNINYHADDAICALLMIFSTNEHGSLGAGTAYTYPLDRVNYYDEILLSDTINPDKTFGNAVEYSSVWTRKDAKYLVENVGQLIDNVLDMIKVKGLEGGINGLLCNLANQYVNDTYAGLLLSLALGNVYKLTSEMFDLDNIVRNVLYSDMSTAYAAQQFVAQVNQRMGTKWGVSQSLVQASDFYKYLSSTGVSSWGDVFYPVEYRTNADGTYVLDGDGNKIPIPVMVYATNSDGEYIYDADGNHIMEEKTRYIYDDEGNIQYGPDGMTPITETIYEHSIATWQQATQDYCETNGIDYVSMGFIKVIKDESGAVTDIDNPFHAKYNGRVISVEEGFDKNADLSTIVFKYNLEIFESILCAVLSPLSVVFDFLFYDRDLSIYKLINIASYAGYYYSLAPLWDALDAPAASYTEVYANTTALKYSGGELITDSSNANVMRGNRNSIYYFIDPLIQLAEELIDNPIEELLSRIPNLMFFITIGGLNTVINDLVHPAYVLLDAVKPIFNAYDLINGLLANLNIGGMDLNLAVPLDIDVNNLLNSLLESNIGGSITVYTDSETGAQLNLALPYIDLTTLCAGTLRLKTSVPQNNRTDMVIVESGGGADLFTAAFRLVTQVLFMTKNADNLCDFLTQLRHLDGFDDDTLRVVVYTIQAFAQEHMVPDYVMKYIVEIMRKIMPTTNNLAMKFNNVDFALQDLFTALAAGITSGDMTTFNNMLNQLSMYGTGSEIGGAVSQGFNLFQSLLAFFKRLFAFIASIFGK